jgi:hypothetical protein
VMFTFEQMSRRTGFRFMSVSVFVGKSVELMFRNCPLSPPP